MRSQIHAEISAIDPLDDVEAVHIASTLAWLDSGAEIYRIQKPDVPPKHLISYFVVTDGDYLLLVDHINAELWLPTGGHVDVGEHPRVTVVREAKEELGITADFRANHPIFLTETSTVGKTSGHTDVSLWYVLNARRDQEFAYDESEFTSIRWFHKDEIPLNRTDTHMARFLRKFYPKFDS